MDSGLGVRWPLSPYATALAAGALFAFCFALWKHRSGARKSIGKDPKGRNFGRDLDPKKEQDVHEKPGKKKNEEEADRTKNFPVLAVTDSRRLFNYEHLCTSGQFGAIPKTSQSHQTFENPNLFSAFRRRNVKKENKNWLEFNPTSSSFSCIYQQPFFFGSEFPRLNAKLLLNVSPSLHTYINQFKDIPIPGVSRNSDFDHFDVSIKPEILRNKPITRSAVCLALERQLDKFLKEPFHEVKFNERAIQTADITEEDENKASDQKPNSRDLNFDSDSCENVVLQSDSTECDKKISAESSIWDSGYGERAFDESCNTSRECESDENNVLVAEYDDVVSPELSIQSGDLTSQTLSESSNQSNDNPSLTLENETQSTFNSNTVSESTDRGEESSIETSSLDTEVEKNPIFPEENVKNSTFENSQSILPVSDYFEEELIKCSEENAFKDACDSPGIHLDSDREPVISPPAENVKNSTFENSQSVLPVSDYFEEELIKCSENIEVSFSEENAFKDACDSPGIHLDSDRESVISPPAENFKNSTFENSQSILPISDYFEEELVKCNEDIKVSFSEENVLKDACDSLGIHLDSDRELVISPAENVKNSTFENSQSVLPVSDYFEEEMIKCSENIEVSFSEENAFKDACDSPGIHLDSDRESVISPPAENAKNSTFENSQSVLSVSDYFEEEPIKCSEDIKVSFSEENVLKDACDSPGIHLDSDRESVISPPAENVKNSTFENSQSILPTSDYFGDEQVKSSEDINVSFREENVFKDACDSPGIHLDSDRELVISPPAENAKNSTFENSQCILPVSDYYEKELIKCSEDIEVSFSEANIFKDAYVSPGIHLDSDRESVISPPAENAKNSSFENSQCTLPVSDYYEKELIKCSEDIEVSFSEANIFKDAYVSPGIHLDSDRESVISPPAVNSSKTETQQRIENLTFRSSDLERFQNTFPTLSEERQVSRDENLFRGSENMSVNEKKLDSPTRASEVDVGGDGKCESIEECLDVNLTNSDLEIIQSAFDSAGEKNNAALSAILLETKLSLKRNSRLTETATPASDVTEGGSSRDSAVFDERGTFNVPRQMDRETGERSVAVESTVTTEATFKANGDARLSTAVVSRLTLDDWSSGAFDREDSVSVRTTVNEEVFRPSFEEFVPLKSSEKKEESEDESLEVLVPLASRNGKSEEKFELSKGEAPSSPRLDRLKGLLSRDEERRSRTKFHHLADSSHVGGAMAGEWDRLLRDVLASVSELERWERRHCDVSSDAEDAEQQHHFSQSDSSFTMEEEALSPKGETPTKVKSLRFKLDPDVFDVPSDDSFYDDDDDDNRRGWKKQSKYRTFSSLELNDEPVRLVSVHASVVPAGQKMVARPVGIDLRVRLTEERQSKRAHVSTSPSQAKRRSPVSDRGIGWCQELSPVTENVDWRETFTPVTPECKSVPNGILKTPSPKIEPSPIESPNPFKLENGVTTNGVSPVTETKNVEKPKYNGWKPVERKPFLLPRKKFEPDPEAIERITGYKSALSKPPLPPPLPHKMNASLTLRNRAEMARKQYLDSKAALAANKVDGTKKFQQFLSQAQNDRARIVTSVPDLAAIERAVTEQWTKERGSVSPRESPGREDNKKTDGVTLSRGSTPDDKWASYVQSCRQHLSRRSQSMTYLETDIDIIPVLDEDDKCHSTSALDEPDEALPDTDDSDLDRSREDLDDSGRAKSEHELRIERSLRSLPIPEWYRRSEKTKTGFLLGSSTNKEKRGWAAVKSLASSTSSLASCGLRRPVRSLRSSRENIPWSRSSASPDGPTLSLALAKAFREPYLGWRARTPTSSGVSSSPRASPPSWGATTTTDDEANGVSFDGEDAFGRTTSSEEDRREPLSLDDTGADAVTVSMDTNDPVKLPGGEDTCDDINNMSMDTCELFDASVVVPVDEDPSPQADTGDDIDNLSTDTTTTEGRKLDPKLKRYSYSQSIYHSEWDEEEESRGDRKGKDEDREPSPSSPDHKVVWIESSFVGSRTTTSIVVLPEKKAPGSTQERPASR